MVILRIVMTHTNYAFRCQCTIGMSSCILVITTLPHYTRYHFRKYNTNRQCSLNNKIKHTVTKQYDGNIELMSCLCQAMCIQVNTKIATIYFMLIFI